MLFQDGSFTSASGIELPFKIDCDALTDDDLSCVAKQVADHVISLMFVREIIAVPAGGERFAAALRPYLRDTPSAHDTLLVDDVWTTGGSMLRTAAERGLLTKLGSSVKACVLVARGAHPSWVSPFATLHPNLLAQGAVWR